MEGPAFLLGLPINGLITMVRTLLGSPNSSFCRWLTLALICIVLADRPLKAGDGAASDATENTQRSIRPLLDGWTIQVADEPSSRPIEVDENWERVLGVDFNGRATYVNDFTLTPLHPQGRVLLEIDGAATHAVISLDNVQLGEHLGGWTPARFDITHLVTSPQAIHRLRIEIDERVGHNTQGFLPIVVPHFGGIWKGVRIIYCPSAAYLDDLTLHLDGFRGDGLIHGSAIVRGANDADAANFQVGWRLTHPHTNKSTPWLWQDILATNLASGASSNPIEIDYMASLRAAGTDEVLGFCQAVMDPLTISNGKVENWSPAHPFRYRVEIALRHQGSGTDQPNIIDRVERMIGIRHFLVDGRKLKINGEEIAVRGVLNWGYAPPRLSPSIDRDAIRQELEFAKQRGFNLMKFCLWIPPRDYFDLADEMGMLTWVEYPTWHPQFNEQTLLELREEFLEFFCYDRNDASVLLRSLTCETGPSASEEVIRQLYDMAHAMIPGSIVEDDSSWIQWHRVHDFYDDHPYGNNHTWLPTLDRLDQHIATRASLPLVLGEAIAADTWEPEDSLERATTRFKELGYSTPLSSAHQLRSQETLAAFRDRLSTTHQLSESDSLADISRRYALQMRKYQIEAFRYRLPTSGYVVSVIRDFPLASMGLIDRNGDPKWSQEDFAWHRDLQLVLNRGAVSRSIASGSKWACDIDVCSAKPFPSDGAITCKLMFSGQTPNRAQHISPCSPELDNRMHAKFEWEIPRVTIPTLATLTANWTDGSQSVENHWDLWIIPALDSTTDSFNKVGIEKLFIHHSIQSQSRALLQLFGEFSTAESLASLQENDIVVASRFDESLLDWTAAGGNCLMLPDGGPHSFATRDHWFLRGGPVVATHLLTSGSAARLPAGMLADLQAFDLASPVLFEFPLADAGTPVLSLWDNHDLDHFRCHTLVWEASLGKGRILVSTLPYGSDSGAAGGFVLKTLIQHLLQSNSSNIISDERSLNESTIAALRDEIRQQQISLADQHWKFKRLAEDSIQATIPLTPVEQTDIDSVDWQKISITRHWDGQGHGDFDGWGIYRTEVTIPENWDRSSLFITTTGVDDYFDLFVDGEQIGSGGDIIKKQTAFELRASYRIPDSSSADGKLELAVRVYDWQGAGGIFRPIYLSTTATNTATPLLVPVD